MAIIHWILLLLGTMLDAWLDDKLIKERRNVHTAIQYIVRESVFIVLSGLFAPDNRYALYSWILSHLVYWWSFDTILNLFRGKPITYLSDRGMDYFQEPRELWFVLKFIFFGLASAFFFKPELYYL